MYSLCKPAISMCHSGILQICCVPTHQMCITHFKMFHQNIWENMLRYLAQLCIEGNSVQSSGTSFKKKKSLWQISLSAGWCHCLCDFYWLCPYLPPWCGLRKPRSGMKAADMLLKQVLGHTYAIPVWNSGSAGMWKPGNSCRGQMNREAETKEDQGMKGLHCSWKIILPSLELRKSFPKCIVQISYLLKPRRVKDMDLSMNLWSLTRLHQLGRLGDLFAVGEKLLNISPWNWAPFCQELSRSITMSG